MISTRILLVVIYYDCDAMHFSIEREIGDSATRSHVDSPVIGVATEVSIF